MRFKLFSMPACPKCTVIKEYMAESGASGDEASLAEPEGMVEMRRLYPKIRGMIKRSEKGAMPVPIVVFFNQEEIAAIATSIDEIKTVLAA